MLTVINTSRYGDTRTVLALGDVLTVCTLKTDGFEAANGEAKLGFDRKCFTMKEQYPNQFEKHFLKCQINRGKPNQK